MNEKEKEARVKNIGRIGLYVLAFIGMLIYLSFGIGGLFFFIICIAIPSIYGWVRLDNNGKKKDGWM